MRERLGSERSKRSNILRTGLIAASLIAPVHESTRAAEIPRNATWEEGVNELRRSARTERVEHSTSYIRYTDGTHDWLPTLKGTADGVRHGALSQETTVLKYSLGKDVQYQCNIHTHLPYVTNYEGQRSVTYVPPSPTDIMFAQVEAKGVRSRIDSTKGVHAVFDTTGVWYYRVLTDAESQMHPERLREQTRGRELVKPVNDQFQKISDVLSKVPKNKIGEAALSLAPFNEVAKMSPNAMDGLVSRHLVGLDGRELIEDVLRTLNLSPRQMNDIRVNRHIGIELKNIDEKQREAQKDFFEDQKEFLRNSFAPGFSVKDSVRMVEKSFEKNLLAKVRYVPYEELGQEPPCAGPDYLQKQ